MKLRLFVSTLIMSLSFGVVSVYAQTQSSDSAKTKSQTSKQKPAQSKTPKSADDLEAFFKRGEADIKAGNHCFGDKKSPSPKQSDHKPIA